MRVLRATVGIASALLLGGCGYVHFGRYPAHANDAALERAYSDLSLEHKILKQELVLARKESDTLRAALDRGGDGTGGPLAQRLEETTRELAALRAEYAKLQLQSRSGAPAAASAGPALAEVQEKLAASMRQYAQLQEENARLRRDLDAARSQNATLADQLKTSTAGNEQAQAAVAQLNTELLAEKEARQRADQALVALRAQLDAVVARAGRMDTPAASLGPVPASEPVPAAAPASALAALQQAKAPPSGAVAVVELRTNPERVRGAAAIAAEARKNPVGATPADRSAASAAAPASISAPAPAVAPAAPATAAAAATPASASPAGQSATAPARTYTVQAGDTLEKIAVRVYGAADQWSRLYAANAEVLSSGNGLKPGTVLQVPDSK